MAALLDATNGPAQSLVGTRIRDDNDFRGTIRYVGPVATSTKDPSATWYGVEWDDNTRGAISASRRVVVVSLHSNASSPGVMTWVVSFSILRPFGPSRETTQARRRIGRSEGPGLAPRPAGPTAAHAREPPFGRLGRSQLRGFRIDASHGVPRGHDAARATFMERKDRARFT